MKENIKEHKIPNETLEWLKSKGAIDISKCKYYMYEGNTVYSEEYLANTPLEVIKERYQRHVPKTTDSDD